MLVQKIGQPNEKDDSFLWFLAFIYTTKFILVFEQDAPYPMNLPKLGHAVIVNNVAKEMPGSMNDVKALEAAFRTVGFGVEVHTNMTKIVCNLAIDNWYRFWYSIVLFWIKCNKVTMPEYWLFVKVGARGQRKREE